MDFFFAKKKLMYMSLFVVHIHRHFIEVISEAIFSVSILIGFVLKNQVMSNLKITVFKGKVNQHKGNAAFPHVCDQCILQVMIFNNKIK